MADDRQDVRNQQSGSGSSQSGSGSRSQSEQGKPTHTSDQDPSRKQGEQGSVQQMPKKDTQNTGQDRDQSNQKTGTR